MREVSKVNYEDYIKNKRYNDGEMLIKELFIPKDVKYFNGHNYQAELTIFDFKFEDYFKMTFLTDYEITNPISRSKMVYFLDDNGDFEYDGKKYKSIKNLEIDSVEMIPFYAFTGFEFDTIKITNVKKIDKCAFFLSTANSISIDNNIEYIGYSALTKNLNAKDGYYDIPGNDKLILVSLDKAEKPEISPQTRIIFQSAAKNYQMIKELIIPEGVTMIGDGAFENCKTIDIVSLPKSLKHINAKAFAHTFVKSLYYDGTLEEFKNIEIDNEDWSYREWIDRPMYLDSSPMKKGTDLYIKDDEKGYVIYNNKRYRLI